jgi:hypothetical protein
MLAFVTTLFVAPLMNVIVAVSEVADNVVLAIVKLSPPVLTPSIVTLSAPLSVISDVPPTGAPVIVRATPPTGLIETAVYDAEPVPLALSDAVTASVEFPQTSIVMTPVWVPAFTASNAALSVAYAVGVVPRIDPSASIGPAVSHVPTTA